MHKKNNAALGFIFITLLVDCIGIGDAMLPVLPDLLKELTHGSASDAAPSYWRLAHFCHYAEERHDHSAPR